MSNDVNNLYEFGDFRFDGETNTLRRDAALIALSPKASELLKLLLERDGGIVSKREIFDSIWADTFVEDGVLTQNIYTLRNALGTDENGKQLIENIARRGYRFAAPVRIVKAFEVAPENKKILQTVSVGGKAANSSVESFENELNAASNSPPINDSPVIGATQIPFVSSFAFEEKIHPRRSFRYALFIGLGF